MMLRMDRPFKSVIFDLDGTLLNTLADLTDAVNAVLEMRGFPARTEDEVRGFVGDGAAMLCRRILPENARQDGAVASCLADFRKIYGKNWNAKTRPYPGIKELLKALEEKGLALAVLSNKPHAVTNESVKYFFPETPFKIVLGEREGTPKKPHPQGALEIAAALKLDPGEILYLGDTAVDMQTAVAAGMHPVGALWGFRSKGEIEAAGALELVRTPGEVAALL